MENPEVTETVDPAGMIHTIEGAYEYALARQNRDGSWAICLWTDSACPPFAEPGDVVLAAYPQGDDEWGIK